MENENTLSANGESCPSCANNGLKPSRNNGSVQIMVPSDYATDRAGQFTAAQENEIAQILAGRNLRHSGESAPFHSQAEPSFATINPMASEAPFIESPTGDSSESFTLADAGYGELICAGPTSLGGNSNFTLGETDAADVLPGYMFQQAGNGEEEEPDYGRGVRIGRGDITPELEGEIHNALKESEEVENAAKALWEKRGTGACKCLEVTIECEYTSLTLTRVERNKIIAEVVRPSIFPDSDLPITIARRLVNRYVYTAEVTFSAKCTKSAKPDGCADDWAAETGSFTAIVFVDELIRQLANGKEVHKKGDSTKEKDLEKKYTKWEKENSERTKEEKKKKDGQPDVPEEVVEETNRPVPQPQIKLPECKKIVLSRPKN